MERTALKDLNHWWNLPPPSRKPLVIRGARQVGKSFLIRDFCKRLNLNCFEINFEKEPSLRKLFIEGHNSKTLALLETHFGRTLDSRSLLFLDEIQSTPEVFARLRYFFEDSPHIAVIAAGSLLEFTLSEIEYSVPVGRIEYLYLGPMSFEEYLLGQQESALLKWIREWKPQDADSSLPSVLHEKLLAHTRDFSLIGGMPEAVQRFTLHRDFLGSSAIQRAILETYRNDFSKFRKRIPLERLERVYDAIPAQVGKKWVHARINPHEKAHAIESALHALCKAKVAHQIFHSSGNGVPLSAEQKDNLYKVLFIDVGLMSVQLGLRVTDLSDAEWVQRVNEGAIAEQWVGQHLLDLRPYSQPPRLHYWVREKAGSMAEVDYLLEHGPRVFPIEIKAGPSTKAASLKVFLSEKNRSPLGIHFSTNPARLDMERKILELPLYMVEQVPRVLDSI